MRHPEEPLERRAPVVPQPHRVVVHVHEHEAAARLLVDAAAIAHGVLDGLVDIGVRVVDGIAQRLREAAVHILPEVAAHHVDAERER